MSSGRSWKPVANRSMIRNSSKTWKSFTDGSPPAPRVEGSWRSRSSKKLAVARTGNRPPRSLTDAQARQIGRSAAEHVSELAR